MNMQIQHTSEISQLMDSFLFVNKKVLIISDTLFKLWEEKTE